MSFFNFYGVVVVFTRAIVCAVCVVVLFQDMF